MSDGFGGEAVAPVDGCNLGRRSGTAETLINRVLYIIRWKRDRGRKTTGAGRAPEQVRERDRAERKGGSTRIARCSWRFSGPYGVGDRVRMGEQLAP